MQRLTISENKRFLALEDGTPFFWLGDTAWELFHKLTREEADLYLRTRAEQKFNVIQAVALAELEGLTTPNAYGRFPLKKNDRGEYDPALPDTDGDGNYWEHVDSIIDKAAELGLYIALLPTWGDKYNLAWGKGPVIFTPDNARVYGRWLGHRYANRPNILWVMGGDRPQQTSLHFEVNRALAEGLAEADGGLHLRTFHPQGDSSSSTPMHGEAWLDFNMIQSGHHDVVRTNYIEVKRDYELTPIKPTIDAEPCYEDHPINFKPENGYFDEKDVRIGAYYAVFSGAFGHTYGHHSIWSMTREPASYFIMSWKDALLRPGAAQMQHIRELIEQYPFFERVPDQSLIAANYEGANYMVATRGRSFALIYSPNGIPFRVTMGVIDGDHVSAFWFDPRTGARTAIDTFSNAGEASFAPPTSGRDGDWVLILEGQA